MMVPNEVTDAIVEEENMRIRVEKALTGKKSLPEAEVIRRQSEKWAAAWRRKEKT